MGSTESSDRTTLGNPNYINRNCWLANNVNRPPSKRCQYCELAFKQCLFARFLTISLVLVVFLLVASYLIDHTISKPLIVSLFVLIIVYGYYFDRSTESIIETSFSEKKAKRAFQELSVNLKQKVEHQTRDITRKNAHLQQLLRTQSEFLDISSHQLRTPVSVIRGVVSMFLEGDMDDLPKEKQRAFLRGVKEKTEKLESIINDILTASEFDSRKFAMQPDSPLIRLEDVVEEAVRFAATEAEQRQIELQWTKPAQPLPMVRGESKFLEQAVYNLTSNALKYTPSTGKVNEARSQRNESGLVRVSLAEEHGSIVVQIRDNGIGIPKEEMGKLFQKFARANNATAMYTDGSGLGLYIVKQIVEGHNGKVWVESEVNHGSSFFLSLPIAQQNTTHMGETEKTIAQAAQSDARHGNA